MDMRGLIDKKKGSAHFEMIFSFVFFVGFVFFLFVVLKPQDTSTLSGSVLSELYDAFEEHVYTNLTEVFLMANHTDGDKSCFSVELPSDTFKHPIGDGGSYVESLSSGEVDSILESSGVLSVYEDGYFYRILMSPEFDDGNTMDNCENLIDYKLGGIIESRVVSHKALENMTERYFNDYEGLRESLRVPPIFDFSISAENLSGIVMEPSLGAPTSVEVQVRDYVVGVLNNDTGKITNERFSLKIW